MTKVIDEKMTTIISYTDMSNRKEVRTTVSGAVRAAFAKGKSYEHHLLVRK